MKDKTQPAKENISKYQMYKDGFQKKSLEYINDKWRPLIHTTVWWKKKEFPNIFQIRENNKNNRIYFEIATW